MRASCASSRLRAAASRDWDARGAASVQVNTYSLGSAAAGSGESSAVGVLIAPRAIEAPYRPSSTVVCRGFALAFGKSFIAATNIAVRNAGSEIERPRLLALAP